MSTKRQGAGFGNLLPSLRTSVRLRPYRKSPSESEKPNRRARALAAIGAIAAGSICGLV
jgi:hypothetical protein